MKRIFFRCVFLCLVLLAPRVRASANDAAAVSLTSSNLPIFVINTMGKTIFDEPKITATLGVIYNGEGVRNNITDPFNNYSGLIGIEIRGSSSQTFDKQQYGFTTSDAAGADNDVALLGCPAEHSWILSASYNDKTLMRDAVTFNLTRQMGRYASRTKFCEVVINGEYRGVFILMEKIKRGKNRVNISKMTTADTTGDTVTGGYIYKIDKADKATDKGWDAVYAPFATSARRYVMYQYDTPDGDEIMPQQMAYIKGYEKQFETLMYASTYKDSAIGYPSFIDVPSFVDMVIMNELSKNIDAYRLSTFLYKNNASKNNRLFAGPVWDYSIGFGNANYGDGWIRTGWQLDLLATSSSMDNYAGPFWWKKLWADAAFKKAVAIRWKSLRTSTLSTTNIIGLIDSLAATVDEGQQRNFERWPIIGSYVWPNYYYLASSYQDEVNYLKSWFLARTDWMDRTLLPLATAVIDREHAVTPATLVLEQNYPNPFNPSTTIRYSLGAAGPVRFEVFDVLGRCVALLIDGVQAAGAHEAKWDAATAAGGVYYGRLTAGAGSSVIRMTVLK
jgi:hypothetical protein